jgi:tetratricopeptide (TPR) repeat protein
MANEELPKPGREPLSDLKRKRLERIFEIAGKKATAASAPNDFDYVTDLLGQCVTGDPANAIYVRAYIDNLHKKFGNPKKINPLVAQFKERGARSALKKALAQSQWDEVIAQGLKVLTANPWDVPALTGMAAAAGKTGDRDCELCYLKAALTGAPKDPTCNKLFAIALRERGLLDQSIVFWRRVEEAVPGDSEAGEEARRMIATMTVEKARSRGEYDEDDESTRILRQKAQEQEEQSFEKKTLRKIQQSPQDIANYLELSQFYLNDDRFQEAENLLAKAYELSDNDADIREKWEDAQLRHLRQKITLAKDPNAKKKLQEEYFEKDLEVYKNRVARYPGNLSFKFELGYRYMLTKRYAEAIQELQVARNDPRRKGVSLLVLGQCFQHIKQFRLARDHYEAAIQEIPDRDGDNKKRALYLAGRLAMALKDVEAAEKYLTTLAGLDFTYRDASALLDKIAKLRENPGFADAKGDRPAGPEADQPSDQGTT